MGTPELHLSTCFVLNDAGRITSTREFQWNDGPLFTIVRSAASCAWAVHADVPVEIASELDRLAQEELPTENLRTAPIHADRYISLLRNYFDLSQQRLNKCRESDGPAFDFPESLFQPDDVVVINDERLLEHNFRGWVPREIEGGAAPVLAIIQDGHPVSICFCARRSDVAAEAGVETALAYRGKGFAARVTAAWASAIRKSGRIPLYSTSWTNNASLGVARKLKLRAYASDWSLHA